MSARSAPGPRKSPAALKEQILRRARALKLDDLGVTTAEPLPHAEYFREFLQQGRGGDLEYLQKSRNNPADLLEGTQSVLVAAVRYARPEQEITHVAAYAQRDDYHRVMRTKLEELAATLRDLVPGSCTRVLVDTAPLLEKEAAARAGLGWIGKSTMLVHTKFGCYTLLGEVLWTEPLPPDIPGADRCGSCRQCIEACPTGALDIEYQMDARRCLSYMSIERRGQVPEEYREAMGSRAFGCDACIAACPFGGSTIFEESGLLPTVEALRDRSLQELLHTAAQRFQHHYGWTPVERARKRGFLRSLLIVAGNSGDPSLAETVAQFLDNDDALISEHALWALHRLKDIRGNASASS